MPEQHQIPDSDPAVQIYRFLAVVPPARMKPFLHEKAGEVLQRSADSKGQGKGRSVSRFIGREAADGQCDQQGAAAVERQDRPR